MTLSRAHSTAAPSRTTRPIVALATVVGAWLCAPFTGSHLAAQVPVDHTPERTFSVHAGVAPAFAQLGSSLPMFALRVARQLGTPMLLAEGSIGMLRGSTDGMGPSVIPEGQLQLQLPRAVAPYLGLGAGGVSGSHVGRRLEWTTTAAIGVRLARVIPGSVLRIEARARGFRSAPDSQLELTTGMGWAF